MFCIKTNNPNYLARIIRLPELQKCPNADKLQICNVLGNSVITGIEAKQGDIYVYFPLESCINLKYLSWSNSFSSAELNVDKSKKGFFSNGGRVKACRLRGSKSEGYIVPITDLRHWLYTLGYEFFKITDDLINKDFDSFGDVLICEKYVNKQELARIHRENNKKDKKTVRVSKIIDDQFRLSRDVEQLGRNLSVIDPNGIITVTMKLHGSNFSVSRVLCKKPLVWYEKVLKKLGVNIIDKEYSLVYASRNVIKNAYADKVHNSFYDSNIWSIVADKLKDCLLDGVTCYGEVVGYTPTGSPIQKGYDYGCDIGQLDFYVFRLTYTSSSGQVFEFSWQKIKEYCTKFNIKHVPEFYYGKAKDLFNVQVDDNWHNNFLAALKEKYLEKDCTICKNKVPAEGIVVVPQYKDYQPLKLKSFRFLEGETKELDKGTVDIETQESLNM